jgi:hypothetical protein
MDDLLVSRPGGNIRVKRLDSITPLQTPQIGTVAFDMMRYLDEIRAGRTGVSPEGNATPQNIGNKVGSEGVERLMTAKEELVGLIIRVIAETGIKPLCIKIRDLAKRHIDTMEDFQFRGQWTQINPASWIERNTTTVRVGTGSGNHQQQLQAVMQVAAMQEKIMAMPGGMEMVPPNKIYSTLDDLCKFSGLTGAERYFIDPASEKGQQAMQAAQGQQQADKEKQDAMEAEQMRWQAELAQSATTTAQAQQANVQLKGEVELAKHKRELEKMEYEKKIGQLEQDLADTKLALDTASKSAELQFKYDQLEQERELAIMKGVNDNLLAVAKSSDKMQKDIESDDDNLNE